MTVKGRAESVCPGGAGRPRVRARRGRAAHELPREAQPPQLLVVERRAQPREQLIFLLADVVVEQGDGALDELLAPRIAAAAALECRVDLVDLLMLLLDVEAELLPRGAQRLSSGRKRTASSAKACGKTRRHSCVSTSSCSAPSVARTRPTSS
jgi:hypothetical protein